MKNEIIKKEKINVEDFIYEVRGKQVMLDSDLANLYQVETKRINEAVRNNPNKFPERFSWKLTDEECEILLVEIFDQKRIVDKRGGKYKNPRVFNEQGIAMLATILKSERAIQISICIMDAFVYMRSYLHNNHILINELNNIKTLTIKNSNDIRLLEESFNLLNKKQQVNSIFFKGQIYDAYSLLLKILKGADKEIIIIDNYINETLLDILKEIKINIKIITDNINQITINKYQEQYKNIEIVKSKEYHDRYIILDNKEVYHSGASFKDIGNKCFSINKIEDKQVIELIVKNVNDTLNKK